MIVGTRLRSVVMIAVMTSFALAFYMISLKVSAERSAVERLERRIASSMMSIRQLQSELGTRERLPQIEKWNAEVLALSAPKAGQYLDGAVELAAFANDGRPSLDARLQPAIADGEQAPRTAHVRTVAYASVAKPAASPGQPVVTFTAEREGESGGQPLLRTASYRARPDRPAAASVLSASVLTEIRDVAALEASGLTQARVR